MEHLGHDPAAEQAAVGDGALRKDGAEDRVVVGKDRQLAVFVRYDVLSAARALHGEQIAHIYASTTLRLDTLLRRLGQFGRRLVFYGCYNSVARNRKLRPARGTSDIRLFRFSHLVWILIGD